MISLWSNDCLMNSCLYYTWIYPMIAWNSYHMHHIEIILGKRPNFDQKSKFSWHWTLKIGDFNWKGQREDHETRKCNKIWKNWPLTTTVDRWPGEQPVRWGWEFKPPSPALHFSHFLLHSLKSLHIPASRIHFWPDFGPIAGCGLDFGTPRV